MALRFGSKGAEVRLLQERLQAAGFYRMRADGDFGDGTERAVRAFQRANLLAADGIAGPKTQRVLAGRDDPKRLTHEDIERAAQSLGVDEAAVLAVNEIESAGDGFIGNAQLVKILYERHVMYRRLVMAGVDASAVASRQPNLVNQATGGYEGGIAEHHRLDQAKLLNERCALESCSWGAFQIMGYHAERLGYASVFEFTERMAISEGEHLDAFVRFVKADPTIHAALQRRDFTAFARGYNGPDYARHSYDTRITAAYERHVYGLWAPA